MAVEREKGYEYRGWKLGEKVKFDGDNKEHIIIGFDENSCDSFIAIDSYLERGVTISESFYATSFLKNNELSLSWWISESEIEKIESDVENAKNQQQENKKENFDSCIIKLKQIEEESKKMLKEVKQCKHYSDTGIEPIEFIIANNYGFSQGNIVKYNHRIGKKKGQEVSDIKKIIDYALLLAYEKGIELNEDELIELIKYRINIIKRYNNDRQK